MALSKVNLVRLKSGEAPVDGSVVTFDSTKSLYGHQAPTGFAYDLAPRIDLSLANNTSASFISDSSIPIKSISVDGSVITPTNQSVDLGSHFLSHSEVSNGAHSQHFVSVATPNPASGNDGDLWFVIA